MPPADRDSPAQPHLPVNLAVLPAGERLLLAVSGGADSMALLLTLHGRRDLVIGHVNHGLRGVHSDADETFVEECANQLGVPFVARRVLPAPGRGGGAPNEAAAREARYAALIEMALAANCPRVATGHTASDQLETSLINWLRGAAVAGLTGMAAERPLAHGLVLARPLLEATRQQTRAYCVARGQAWREDASNESSDYLRNRIRHELVPLLARIGHRDAAQLELQSGRAAGLLRDDLELLDALAEKELATLTLVRRSHLLALDGRAFRELHPALARRVLRCAVRQLQGDLRDLDAARVEAARRHIAAGGRRKVWQWRRGVNVEWTGPMCGNRIRLWVVGQFDPGGLS